MNNQRLKEIRLALCLNHIDKSQDKNEYSMLVKTLSAIVAAIGKKEHEIFTRIFQRSIGDGLISATKKELVASCKLFYTIKTFSEKFGKSPNWYYYKYNDVAARDFITQDFLDSLTPQFNSEKEVFVVNLLLNFIDNIKFELGEPDSEFYSKERTLEIEFYLIYNKLMEILRNNTIVRNVVFNICNLFNIDFNDISQLLNSIHLIDRTYPNFKYNHRYFMQEICTLYTKKGLSKGAIGSKVLNKSTNFFYNNTNKECGKIIEREDIEWQYVPTISWDNIEKGAVLKFINIFHSFIKYDV